jgi:hypothetical protein
VADFNLERFDKDLKRATDLEPGNSTFLLYGQAGSGKTTMIGTFPTPILYFNLTTEGSINTLRGDPETFYYDIDSSDTLTKKMIIVEANMKKGYFPFKTVAVDSLSFLVEMFIRERRLYQEAKNKGLTQADWGMVANTVNDALHRINAWENCTKVYTAGVDTEKDELTGDIEGYPKMFKTLQRSVWNMMDVLLYLEAGKNVSGKPEWWAYPSRHRYFSARIRGAEVPSRIEPTYEAVMKLMVEKPLFGTAEKA